MRAHRALAAGMDVAGVLVQKTNHGGGSPYLRGLVGNHVLILVDGVRLNNATVRPQANFAAASSKRGVVSLLKPCCVPG